MHNVLYYLTLVSDIEVYKRKPVSVIGTAYWCNRYRKALFALNDDPAARHSALVNWTFWHYTPTLFALLEQPCLL